jgi:hypothetical protein
MTEFNEDCKAKDMQMAKHFEVRIMVSLIHGFVISLPSKVESALLSTLCRKSITENGPSAKTSIMPLAYITKKNFFQLCLELQC